MAFANEHMTDKETDEFYGKKIRNPGNKLSILRPSRWTIDREQNVFLVWGLQEREEPHDYHFLLVWKNTPIPVMLRKSWIDNNTCEWRLLNIDIPRDMIEKRHEITDSLKDALTAFGFSGAPDDPLNQNMKVRFDFNRQNT